MREAIFDLIGQDLTGLNVLDLFAGTGSLGIEALSRGAWQVLFIDHSIHSIRLIKKNLALCGYESKGMTMRRDLTRGLPWKYLLTNRFDMVFLDPPYGKGFIPLLLKELMVKKVLTSPSMVIAESSKTDDLPHQLEKMRQVDERLYGETKISIYFMEALHE